MMHKNTTITIYDHPTSNDQLPDVVCNKQNASAVKHSSRRNGGCTVDLYDNVLLTVGSVCLAYL